MKAGGANGEKEMKKIRAHRVSGIVLYAMLAMTVAVAVLFFFGGEVPMAGRVVADVSQSEPRYTDALLCWVYALLGLAVVVALGTALRKLVLGFVNAPGAMARLWVGAGLLVALLGGAWLAGSGEPLEIPGYGGTENVSFWLKLADMFLYAIYVLLGVAVLLIVGSGIARKLR